MTTEITSPTRREFLGFTRAAVGAASLGMAAWAQNTPSSTPRP